MKLKRLHFSDKVYFLHPDGRRKMGTGVDSEAGFDLEVKQYGVIARHKSDRVPDQWFPLSVCAPSPILPDAPPPKAPAATKKE